MPKRKFELQGGSEIWLHSNTTQETMNKIYELLTSRAKEARDKEKRIAKLNYSEINSMLGINRKQIAYACMLMAVGKDQSIRILAKKEFMGRVVLEHEVELIS